MENGMPSCHARKRERGKHNPPELRLLSKRLYCASSQRSVTSVPRYFALKVETTTYRSSAKKVESLLDFNGSSRSWSTALVIYSPFFGNIEIVSHDPLIITFQFPIFVTHAAWRQIYIMLHVKKEVHNALGRDVLWANMVLHGIYCWSADDIRSVGLLVKLPLWEDWSSYLK